MLEHHEARRLGDEPEDDRDRNGHTRRLRVVLDAQGHAGAEGLDDGHEVTVDLVICSQPRGRRDHDAGRPGIHGFSCEIAKAAQADWLTPTTTGRRSPQRSSTRRVKRTDSSGVSLCASPIIPRMVMPAAPQPT